MDTPMMRSESALDTSRSVRDVEPEGTAGQMAKRTVRPSHDEGRLSPSLLPFSVPSIVEDASKNDYFTPRAFFSNPVRLHRNAMPSVNGAAAVSLGVHFKSFAID